MREKNGMYSDDPDDPDDRATGAVERSPEKAGVGGSIPSLATIFSTAYKAPLRRFHSISFQNYDAGRFASSGMLECSGVAILSTRRCWAPNLHAWYVRPSALCWALEQE